MKIGMIGLGNMASAMIKGMLEKGMVQAQDIIGCARTAGTKKRMKDQYGIHIAESNAQVAELSDILFLAVKPAVFPEVIGQIRDSVREETVIISIAAGITLDYMERAFDRPNLKLMRCMPNVAALVLEGCTALCAGAHVSTEEIDRVCGLLDSFGKASMVPESLMDVVVGVSGSSPAYVFMFIEAMADAAVAGGMPRAQAYEFAARSVMGSARMVLETRMHPGALKDMVCSPGGTTIQAVKVLEEKGFRGAVMDAVEACVEKSRRL